MIFCLFFFLQEKAGIRIHWVPGFKTCAFRIWGKNKKGKLRFLCSHRRTDSTELEVVLVCFSPTGVDKAADADPCTQRLSAIYVLRLSRSDGRCLPPVELCPVKCPRLQNTAIRRPRNLYPTRTRQSD